MIKMELSAILYSKKNYDLSYKVHNVCREFSINLITALDFVELTIKGMEIKPQIIFCDCDTIDFSSCIINAFIEKAEFKNSKIIFIGDNNSTKCLRNIICNNLMLANSNELSGLLNDLQSELSYDYLATKHKDEAFRELDQEILNLLSDLGFSLKYSGSQYLKTGIKNVILHDGILHSLSTNEYPFIASIHKTGVANVERNIRNAIEKTWMTYGIKNWTKFFYSNWLREQTKPTNREFIYMCAEILLPRVKLKVKNY